MTASATKKMLVVSALVATGIILGYVENMFSPIIPVYGLKIGFSNLVVIFALYKFNTKTALIIGALKSLLTGILFSGLMSVPYSATGIMFSVFTMHFLKNCEKISEIGVSVSGSGMFQVGQVLVASAILKSEAPLYYLSYLLMGSVPCGVVSGIIVSILRKKSGIIKGV
ncbi:MAG: Gx transporter family protein [Clostridia bacterium]|nr:Gx transporter family protein [Clostridia bacterium]